MADTKDLFIVVNWDRDFENNRSRQIGKVSFFVCGNQFDGKKIRSFQALNQKRGEDALFYGLFHCIVAIASRCKYRGVLLDDDGPLSAFDLQLKSGFATIEHFQKALEFLSKEGVRMLKRVEVERKNGVWELPEDIRHLVTQYGDECRQPNQQNAARAQGDARTSQGDGSTSPVNNGKNLDTKGALYPERHSNASGRHLVTPKRQLAREKYVQQNRTEGNRTELPSVVSPRGERKEDGYDRLVTEEAKALFCEKIFGGRNPGQLWPPDAEDRLQRMVDEGLLRHEVELVAWYHALPEDDEYPELKKRTPSLTPSALMLYWGDILTRAESLSKRMGDQKERRAARKKVDPPRWREFFRARYPEADEFNLPESFQGLEPDMRRIWEQEHVEWEQQNPELPIVV